MTHPKASDQLAKRGPKSKFGPKKLAWLHSLYDEWKTAEGKNIRREFYRRLAQLCFQTFGYELPYNDNSVGVVEVESLLHGFSSAGLTEEEVQRMATLAKETNTKLQAWCRNTFQYSGANSSQANETVENMFDSLIMADTTSSTSVPRKPGMLQYYASKQWPKIYPVYLEYCERDKAEHTRMVESAASDNLKKPKPMKAQNPAIKKCWDEESAEFCQELEELRDAEWLEKEKEIAAKASMTDDAPRTPAQYQASIYNCGLALQPIIDAIYKKMGLNCTIILSGPFPKFGGDIRTITSQGGQTLEANPRRWKEYDHTGYIAACSSFAEFSRACFSLLDREKAFLDWI